MDATTITRCKQCGGELELSGVELWVRDLEIRPCEDGVGWELVDGRPASVATAGCDHGLYWTDEAAATCVDCGEAYPLHAAGVNPLAVAGVVVRPADEDAVSIPRELLEVLREALDDASAYRWGEWSEADADEDEDARDDIAQARRYEEAYAALGGGLQ